MKITMALAPALLGFYILLLIGASMWKSSEVSSPAIQMLRAFFPNWKFFEDLGTLPRLSYRFGPLPESLGDWRTPPPARKQPLRLLYNSEGNLHLALGSLLQHLESDLLETDESRPEMLETATSYRLVRNWVESELENETENPQAGYYQFRLTALQPNVEESELILLSPIYSREAPYA